MTLRGLQRRVTAIERATAATGPTWVDAYVAALAMPSRRAARTTLKSRPDELRWFYTAKLGRSPIDEPLWLLEPGDDTLRSLERIRRSGSADPARDSWRVILEHERAMLPMLDAFLVSEGGRGLGPEQEETDLARYWALATGTPWRKGLGASVREFALGTSGAP